MKDLLYASAIEDVVTQNKNDWLFVYEILADQKCVGYSTRYVLYCVFYINPKIGAVPE